MPNREFLMAHVLNPLAIPPPPPPEPPPPPPPSPIGTGRFVDVSRDGSTIAIGQDTSGFTGGAIHMCRGPEFGTVTTLTAPGGFSSVNEYGYWVATNADGSIVVCGALRDGETIDGYAAVRHGTNWEDETIVEPAGSSIFLAGTGGKSVAISDDGSVIVVTDGTKVFVCSGIDWADVIELTPTLGVWCVAISGDGTVVAAGNGGDRVHVYSGTDYATHTLVTPTVLGPGGGLGEFGWSVGLNSDGSLLVVGNPSDGPAPGAQYGAGYLYSGEDWATEQKFVAGEPYTSPEYYGWASDISADGSVVAFSAYGRAPGGVVFRYDGEDYSVVTEEASFGYDLALSEDGSVMAVASGSVYVFSY